MLFGLFGIGTIARMLPFLDRGGRLLSQFPTEDGYFMLTMARNLAEGNGLSVAGGAVPTNGTQPLATLLWGLAYAAVDGHPVRGVAAVLGLQVVFAGLTAAGIYRLGHIVFGPRARARSAPAIAAAVWLASPVVLPHTMNCLETGLYAAVAVAVALAFVEPEATRPSVMSPRRALALGLLLGLSFWARNDAVFLVLGACLAYVHGGLPGGARVVRRRFARTLVFGATSVAVALPWLGFNLLRFGHPMPVSGRAESVNAGFGENLHHLPAELFNHVALVLPIPYALHDRLPVVLAALVALAAVFAVMARTFATWTRPARQLAVLVGIYGLGLCTFYGLFFGAPWFTGRYLMPLSPFAALLWAAALVEGHGRLFGELGGGVSAASRRSAGSGGRLSAALVRRLRERFAGERGAGLALPLAVALLLSAGLQARIYVRGDSHPHFQVVEWVALHVPPEAWVGAVQTGTLGYFHERTLNLDGKVNVAAYEALAGGRLHEYTASSEVQYLVDWAGLVDWAESPVIAEAFELSVHDPEQNLAVLVRRR